jgi:hypothetical protein
MERLWKFVKTECLHSRYYEKFPEFCQAIELYRKETAGEHKSRLDTLLSLKKFQRFPKAV